MRSIITTLALGAIASTSVLTGSATAAAGPAGSAGGQIPDSVSMQTALPASQTLAVTRRSSKCNSPKGKRFNVSWGEGGQSTTFYFNNHCDKKRRIFVYPEGTDQVVDCIEVNPHTKGRKKIGRTTDDIDVRLLKKKCP
ncbi:hypothetical protein [Nonomuraea sp. NPDC049400]|uniref:hypothetical protein n=1 Tax=Nonomuraea sp. NPDC049400 TaxID=3364352 RepID=UPI00379F13D8